MALMATFGAMGDYGQLGFFFDEATLALGRNDANSFVFVDQYGARVVFSGSGFTFAGGLVTGGTITDAVYRDADNKVLFSVANASANASLLEFDTTKQLELLGARNDSIYGTNKVDYLIPGSNAGNDKIYAYGGNDTINGSSGNNFYHGGTGSDSVNYVRANVEVGTHGIVVRVADGEVDNAWGGVDRFVSIERFSGTQFDDRFVGNNASNSFNGEAGNDVLIGKGGADTFVYFDDSGRDRITDFGRGADKIMLTFIDGIDTFADVRSVMSQSGNDVVIDLGAGNDITLVNTLLSEMTKADFTIL